MSGVVHIVPVGHTTATLLDSIKQAIAKSLEEYPISKVVFVLGKKDYEESEKKARDVADDVEKGLGIIPCERIYVDLDDVLSAAYDIVLKIKRERTDKDVIVNLSGSLRTVDIAGYIAASITNSKVIIGLPSYKDGKLEGVRAVKDISLMPIEEISPEKLSVLGLLNTSEWKSLDDLAKELSKKSKAGYKSLKSKISFHLKYLRQKKFVETKREKRTLLIKLSGLGKVYYEGLKK